MYSYKLRLNYITCSIVKKIVLFKEWIYYIKTIYHFLDSKSQRIPNLYFLMVLRKIFYEQSRFYDK